jgi:hypothetical protein
MMDVKGWIDDDGIEARRPDAPPGLFLSRKGAWYHDGDRVGHHGLEGLLWRSIARDVEGRLIVTTGRDVLPFVAEDAPLLIKTIVRGGTAHDVKLVLADGSEEPLAARPLLIDDEGRLRCAVKGGRFWALCARSATQLLMELVDDDGRIATPTGSCALTSTGPRDWSLPPT